MAEEGRGGQRRQVERPIQDCCREQLSEQTYEGITENGSDHSLSMN